MIAGGEDDRALMVDTNVLVYAALPQAPLHGVAQAALHIARDAGTPLWISRQIIREYIRSFLGITAQARVPILSPDVAEAVRRLTHLFSVADETDAVTARLIRLVETVPMGGAIIHDANIVASMQAYGVERLLTHNGGDFARFSALITVVPLV